MNGFSLLVVAALGVVYSWRTGIDQQQEYVLQIEPEVVQALASGEEIFSELPADAGPFQRLCIVVLAKDATAVRHTAAAEQQFRQLYAGAGRYASRDRNLLPADPLPTLLWPGKTGANPEQTYGVNTGWQPDKTGQQQYLVQIDPTVLSTFSLGDELYVPIDPAAGRIVRFIVKSGRENLPRLGGAQAASTAPLSLPNPPAIANGRTRPSGWLDGSSNWSSGSTTADTTRPQSRFDSGVVAPSYADPRGNAFNAGGAPSLAPDPSHLGTTYPNYQQPGNTYPQATDPYRTGVAPGAYPLQPPASQQPQLPPVQRPYSQFPETRVTGLPPSVAAGTPQITNPSLVNPSAIVPGQTDRPWGPLLFVTFALFFSIGGNLYLAYTALEFHGRYRNAIERLRSAARSA